MYLSAPSQAESGHAEVVHWVISGVIKLHSAVIRHGHPDEFNFGESAEEAVDRLLAEAMNRDESLPHRCLVRDFFIVKCYHQDMDKIDKILMPVMAKKGLGGAAVSSQICFYADEWGKDRFDAISYSRGVLKLSVRDSIDAGEVQMDSEKLIDFVNNKMKKNIVKRIRIVNSN